ncbi:ATP-dependent DNA ligase [Mycetocola sp. 2940]|uniref:DUF7882 family protein n=1 Tax=Mycetocola sp. 2940 TaxID=3156452 RepID=UPI003399CF4B
MGTLTYDGVVVEFDDRLLAHLQIVIVQKLRCGESFLLSWKDAVSIGNGRSSVWLHPSIPLYFKFWGSRPPTINRQWIAELTASANSAHGLVVFGEDGSHQPTAGRGGEPTSAHVNGSPDEKAAHEAPPPDRAAGP